MTKIRTTKVVTAEELKQIQDDVAYHRRTTSGITRAETVRRMRARSKNKHYDGRNYRSLWGVIKRDVDRGRKRVNPLPKLPRADHQLDGTGGSIKAIKAEIQLRRDEIGQLEGVLRMLYRRAHESSLHS